VHRNGSPLLVRRGIEHTGRDRPQIGYLVDKSEIGALFSPVASTLLSDLSRTRGNVVARVLMRAN